MRLEPPADHIYVCPQCDGRIAFISGPRWGWLLVLTRRVTVHPCHHRINAEEMKQVLAQAREQADEVP